jgi:hypothetical protein
MYVGNNTDYYRKIYTIKRRDIKIKEEGGKEEST